MRAITDRPRRIIAAFLAASIVATLVWVALDGARSAAGTGNPSRAGVLLASAPVLPDGDRVDVAYLATTGKAIRRTWRHFNLPGGPPGSATRRDALFLGTSESGSCPEEFVGMDRIEGKKLVKVDIDVNWSSGGCTDDFRRRTFVVAARHRFFPKGRFDVKIGDNRRVTVVRRP
ncbi:MAG: hypothetical protein M3198_12280 [Actinomycetota bacterium]|nr:hypothetical protein [Actinomycetota bacterium]